MKLEKDLIKQIKNRLDLYRLTGEVEFYIRINSGSVKTYFGSYVKLAAKGTPDFLALVRGREDKILALFLEAKSDTGKLRKEQEQFKQKYAYKEGFWFMELRDIKELDFWIEKNSKDFVNSLPNDLKDICQPTP